MFVGQNLVLDGQSQSVANQIQINLLNSPSLFIKYGKIPYFLLISSFLLVKSTSLSGLGMIIRQVVGYGCHSPRPRTPEPPTPKRLPHDAVERIQLPPVTVRVGQRFEVKLGEKWMVGNG